MGWLHAWPDEADDDEADDEDWDDEDAEDEEGDEDPWGDPEPDETWHVAGRSR